MDDRRLVQIALDQGLVTADQVAHAERECRTYADRGLDHSPWDLLQDLGYITEERAKALRKSMSSNSVKALEVAGYTIQGRLGSGGMGDVFRGRNHDGGEVAVKLLSSRFHANQEYRRRFDREARASLRLHHQHITRSLDAGIAHGQPYMLMELVEGPSLKTRIHASGPIDQEEALCLLEQMGSALGYAWRMGVLHRDVKPANILLGPPRAGVNEPFCAKLIDFGLAKVWQEGGDNSAEDSIGGLTGAGLALGTPHYMSPEQASGQIDLDQRCDIYGLGASLYHALMGHTMYSGKSSAVIMYKQVTEQIDLSELRKKGTHKQLVDLIGRMLAKDRNRRLGTWDEVAAITARIRAQATAEPGIGSTGDTPRVAQAITEAVVAQHEAVHASSRRAPLVAILAAAVLGVAAAGWWLTSPPGPVLATPGTIDDRLRQVAAGGVRALQLEPGTYPSLRLGAAHAGLTIHGPAGTSIAGLAADPSLNVLIDGIDIAGPIAVAPGATVRCRGGRTTSIAVDGGILDLEGCQVRGPLTIAHSGTISASACSVSSGAEIEDSTANVDACQIQGGLRIVRGALYLRGGSIAGGLTLDRAAAVELTSCRIAGDPIALSAVGSAVRRCEQVVLTAPRLAIAWNGTADMAWLWREIRAEAPSTATGLPPHLTTAVHAVR